MAWTFHDISYLLLFLVTALYLREVLHKKAPSVASAMTTSAKKESTQKINTPSTKEDDSEKQNNASTQNPQAAPLDSLSHLGEDEDADQDDDADEDEDDEEESPFCKMILVVRQDLKMGEGKKCAQCCHASLGAYRAAQKANSPHLVNWLRYGEKKIALKCNGEEELMAMYTIAKAKGLIAYVVRDAGHTQVAPNTKTVLAIGPAPEHAFDEITGNLRLL